MKIAVIGLGFVGLTTALGFASKGFQVSGCDNNRQRVQSILNREVPFLEPGLPEALNHTLGKTFFPTSSIQEAMFETDAVFFCTGTPCGQDNRADLTDLCAAVDSAAEIASKTCVFVVKSTVPPGTVKNKIIPRIQNRPAAMNPEFLRESRAWEDFMDPDRIVIGTESRQAQKVLTELYTPFGAPIHFVSLSTAEFVKYLSNCLLANLISFSNEMALLAEKTGDVSVQDAFHILQEDKRLRGAGIGSYIYPGCGYGGSCLPKDTSALAVHAHDVGVDTPILCSVIGTNQGMAVKMAQKIIAKTTSKEDNIGILGLAFKPGSDDVRYSPAAGIISELVSLGYTNIFAHDPAANKNFEQSFQFASVRYCESAEELCEGCHTVAVVTTWEEFADIHKRYPDISFIDCRFFLKP